MKQVIFQPMPPSLSFKTILTNLIWGFSIMTFMAVAVFADPRSGSLNVCNMTESRMQTVRVQQDLTYDKDVPSSCIGLLGCTRRQKVVIPATKLEQRPVNVTKLTCCDGYHENQNKDCIPICSNACIHGDCHKPEVCLCHAPPSENSPGWSGQTCNRFVCKSLDKWGENCDRDCDSCSSNGFCSADSGQCICNIGWSGKSCLEPCPSDADCRYISSGHEMTTYPRDWISSRASSAEIVADQSEMIENSPSQVVLPHLSIYLLMISAILLLLYASLSYRRRLKIIKDELYYVTYNASGSGNSASGSSQSGNFENPVYSLESEPASDRGAYSASQQFPDKELSFLTASRGVQNKMSPSISSQGHEKVSHYPVNPKVEYNLMTSKKQVRENFYSDQSDQPAVLTSVAPSSGPTLSINNDYQVPRSPARVSSCSGYQPTGCSNEEEANIYEEIKPVSIHKSGDS